MLPRQLKGFNLYLDGESFIARAEEVTLPDLNIKSDEFRGAGMDAPIDLDQGMDKIDVSFTIGEFTPSVIKQLGLLTADRQLVIRGVLQRQGEAHVGFAVRMQGGIKGLNRDAIRQGEKGSLKVTMNCNAYIEEQNGEELVHIDVLNYVRIIGGVDQLATARALL